MKKSLLGAGLAAPKTEPLTRVCEGSGLFSLFLDIARMDAIVGWSAAHARYGDEVRGDEGEKLMMAYSLAI